MSFIPHSIGNPTQPSSIERSIFIHDNFKAISNVLKLVHFNPPKPGNVSMISFLNFGCLIPQTNSNKFSGFSNISELGVGRDIRTCGRTRGIELKVAMLYNWNAIDPKRHYEI